MAEWSWESADAPSSQQASPIQFSSPLQSSSSQSSHEAMQRTSHEIMQNNNSGVTDSSRSPSKSLVETLQTCLTNAPPITFPAGRSLSDPITGAAPPALRQSRSGGTLSGSTSRPLGPTKPAKRRSRASRRVPTTVLEATSNEFLDMVQKLTGVAPATPAPVRPQPKRPAGPSTFIRPDPLVRSVTSNFANFATPTTHPVSNTAFDLHPLQRSASEQFNPFLDLIKREIEGSSLPTTTFAVSGSATSAPSPAMKSWWDAAHEQSQISEIGTSGLSNVASSAAQILSQEDHELSLSQIDAWLASQDHSAVPDHLRLL